MFYNVERNEYSKDNFIEMNKTCKNMNIIYLYNNIRNITYLFYNK